MFDKNVLISCIFIGLALVLYFFYWNRLIALILSLLIRIVYWNSEGSRIWFDIGSIHFSVIAGRILFKDVRYHSSNQTIRIVKGQIQWRYWIRRPTSDEELSSPIGEDAKPPYRPLSCRIQASLQGFEWFLYNRTAAYDYIVSQMDNKGDLNERRKFTAASTAGTTEHVLRVPSFITTAFYLVKNQLPRLDPMDLFPIGIEGIQGVVTLGNRSTPYHLVAEFQRTEGTYGYVQAKSKYDLYRTLLTMKFHRVSMNFIENPNYADPMATTGKLAHDCISQYASPDKNMQPRSFVKLWRQLNLFTFIDKYMSSQSDLWQRNSTFPYKKRLDDATPIGANSSELEYAMETKLLDAPVLDIAYYSDVPGLVPADVDLSSKDRFNIGNGDTDPEWGIDIVIYKGAIRYGPWTDRQRGDLQRLFFPPSWQDVEVTPQLEPGDQRLWTATQILVELRDNTTLQIPFREASKDWQWDGVSQVPNRPRKREPGSLLITAGDSSSIRFTMPIVADRNGYESTVEVHLDSVAITSSLNDISLVRAETCRVHCGMPSPLQWNGERTWQISVTFRDPVLYLVRDHINMLIDLGKDWSSGPPHDYHHFVPTVYVVNFDMHHYNLNMYLNDNNIIDRPHVKEENVLFTASAGHIKSKVTIPSNIFRPDKTMVSFSIDVPDATFVLSLPRWNTHALHAPKEGNTLGRARSIRLEGSYLYFSQVRHDNVEQLHLKLTGHEVIYKALGWSIRYFMALKDNYFGSFTHFSTLGEFLARKEEGLPFGDPIVLKYRPGKANMLQVTMAVDVSASTIVVPAGLPGYELVSDWDTPGEHGIGPCLLLHVPELQMHLRLHDYFMEMSLNVDTLSGAIDLNYPDRLRVPKRRTVKTQDLLMIDRIDISAYRLFGPQPRTATYVCIWEVQLGQVRTVLSASDARILAAAGNAFRVNFVDLFNAPSADFLPRVDPDVTFYKVTVKEIDAVWRTDRAAFSVVMPLGLKVDANDLGSQDHQKVTSLCVPDVVVKLLVSSKQDRSPWLEAAAFETHVSMDIYSAPRQYRSHTRKQVAFIQEQDALTSRAQRMLGHYLRASGDDNISKEQLYMNGVFLPRPAVPDLSRGTRSNKSTRMFGRASQTQPVKLPETSDSDPETGISEAERDARLAKTRSVTPVPQTIVEEDMSSGDESDDADLTDGGSSESVWSNEDSSDAAKTEESLMMHYTRVCRHYKLRRGGLATIWEGSPFVLVKDKSIMVKPALENSSPGIGPVMDSCRSDDDCDVITLHINITGTSEARFTPLVVPAMVLLEEDTEQRLLGPELWIDSLLIKQLGVFLDSGKPPSCLNWKVNVATAVLQVAQHISMLDESHPFISLDLNKEQPPSRLDNMVTLEFGIHDLATSGTTKLGSSACQFSLGSFSANMRTTLDNLALLSSLPGETSFAVTLTSSEFSVDPSGLNLNLGPINFSIGQRSPEFVLATGFAITHTAQQALAVVKRWQAFANVTRQAMVFNILTFSKDIPIVEPLSTIQPSFLVQRGIPSGLRLDARFKFLFHLRDCLGNLQFEQRALLHVVTFADDSNWREGLESRLHALDPDMSVTPIESLFRKPEEVQPAEDTRRRFKPLNLASVRSNGVTIDVLQPSGRATSQFHLSELRSIVRTTLSDVVRAAPAKNLSQTSLRGDKRLLVRRTLVSFVLGDVTMVLVPHVMTFIQHVVRLKPTFAEEPGIPQSPVNPVKQPRFIGVEATISLNRLHIEAAAENLVLEIGIGRVQAASSSLSRSRDCSDQSTNNTLFFGSSYFRARSPQTAQFDGQDILAALEIANGTMSLVTRQEPRSRMKIRLVTSFGDLQLNVPRSALRLYRFVEEWRDDYLPGLEGTVKSLLSEMKKTSKAPRSPTLDRRPAVIQLHGRVDHFGVSLQVMHGTWLSLDIYDTTGYILSANLTSPTTAYTFGLQLSSMVLGVSAKPSTQFKLALPPFTISGYYDNLSIHMLAFFDFIDLQIKPTDWDKLLVVQQKFGQDFNDLLSLMQEAKSKSAMARKASVQPETRLQYGGYLKMKGFRIRLEGMASTLYLECQDIGSGLDGAAGNAWNLTLSNLALSLAPRSTGQRGSAFSRRHKSAFVIIDIMVKAESQSVQASLDVEKHLRIIVTKIHAVMQASSISEMNDFLDELRVEVLNRKEQRSLELAAFKEKARKILRTFEVRVKDPSLEKATSWLDTYVVDIVVQNVGVALPLTYDPELQLPGKRTQETPAVRAFLFSIAKVEFGTHRGETGQAGITQLSFQFVPRFRQSVPSDFLGDNHLTRNRLLYPEMKAHLRSLQLLTTRRIWMGAVVSGFILDIDSTIPDYVSSAIDVYRQGRESVERLSATVPHSQWSPAQSPLLGMHETMSSTSGIFASLKFSSGKIRLFSAQAFNMTKSFLSGSMPKEVSDDQLLQLGVEIFNLPEVTVWAEYRAMPPQRAVNANRSEPPTLMFKSTVHSSENTLRPTLLHFLTEAVKSVEDKLRKASHKQPSHPLHTPSKMPVTPSTPSTLTVNLGLRISFSLRIDRSRLELTCLPDVNVMAGLYWESGGFIVNIIPATQKVTFTGVVSGLTIGLKHGFLSEYCLKLDAHNLAFSVTFGKLHPSHSDSSLSVVLDTELEGGVRFSRLQDVLCFKAVWLDNIPVLNTQLTVPGRSTKATTVSGSRIPAPRLTTSILVQVRRVKANIDLGQSISTVTLDLSDSLLRTRLSESLYELSIFVGALGISAKGNMAGCVRVQDCLFRTTRRMDDFSASQGRMLDLRMTSGPVSMDLDSEHQKLLRYRAEPIAIEIYDDWSTLPLGAGAGEQPLQLTFTVASPEILAIVTIGTIPKLMMYAHRFEANLNAQREGASRESKAFNTTRTPKVDNPLSAVAEAMLESAKTRLKQAESTFTYLIRQHMSFRLNRLQLVVFPRTLEDVELASFIGETVRARLNRLVESGDSPAQRDLRLSFSSLGISRYVQVSHRAASGGPTLQCHEWLKALLNGAAEATIVGLPAMRMRMTSNEAIMGQSKHLIYDFNSEFIRRQGSKQEPEDIFITLNLSLYSWLTVLRKNLTREMEQVRATADRQPSAKIGLISPKGPSKRSSDTTLLPTSPTVLPALSVSESGPAGKEGGQSDVIYESRLRRIERLKLRQLGEATPDVMHPFFMKKSGFNLEESLPQYVHEYATAPLEEIMEMLLNLYSRQLPSGKGL